MDYFLRTARLGFRCWRQDDLPLAMALWSDAAVTAWLGGPFAPQAIRERLSQEMRGMRESGMQYWPVFLLEDGRHVGCAGLRICSAKERVSAEERIPEERIYELGYYLRPAFWGQGLAQEAGRAVIEYGFAQLGAAALFAGHHPANLASRQVLLNLDFERSGEEWYPPSGIIEPTYLLRRPHNQQQ
jgi:RimJ/RimL family protein N-acetyltransferase